MANYEFSPMESKLYMSVLQLITSHRWLYELVVTSGSYGTLALEISFIYVIWNRRLRWPMIGLVVLMHLGIALCMGLVAFSLMMLTMVLAFVPPGDLRRALEALGRGAPHFRLWFNGRVRSQVRAVSVVRAFDAWDQVDLREQPAGRRQLSANELLSDDPEDPTYLRQGAGRR